MKRVWYHANCYDGFGAAWAAYNSLGTKDVEYTPCSYGGKIPEYNPEDEIYIVDFSYPRNELQNIADNCLKLQVLDHHITAEADCVGLPFAIFDMNRSGAGMTWDFFFPKKDRPLLIDLIEDRDLWRFDLAGSKYLHAYLCSRPFDFDEWDRIHFILQTDPDRIWGTGETLLSSKSREVEKVCEGSFLTFLGDDQVAAVNTTAHWSEVGQHLLDKYPDVKCAMNFTVFEKNIMYSLRSRKTDDFDVSIIAKKHGGGGHRTAAGFKIKQAFLFNP